MHYLKPYLAFLILFSALSLADTRPFDTKDTELYPPLSSEEIKGLPLFQSRWLLRSIQGKPVKPGTIITLEFSIDKRGNSCYGKFKNDENYDGVCILKKDNHFTLRGCCQNQNNGAPEKSYEHYYIVTLYSITRYSIVGKTLTFFDQENNNILHFIQSPTGASKPKDLYGKTWRLVSATNMNNDKVSEFTLHFVPKKLVVDLNQKYIEWWESTLQTLEGSTSCRNYHGYYNSVDDLIGVSAIDSTSENHSGRFFNDSCDSQDALAEKIFIDLLKTSWRYEVKGTKLELYSEQDKKLVFNLINP